MHTDYRTPSYITADQQKLLIHRCTHPQDRLLILLMLDCGLRVTELVTLQIKHFNFRDNTVLVRSLKKRDKQHYRRIPLTSRLVQALSEHYVTLANKEPDAYLFPASRTTTKRGHIARQTVWRKIRKKTNNLLYPHILRHTFATRIVSQGNTLIAAKELLGHASVKTTEIYTHITTEQAVQAIRSIDQRSWLVSWREKLFPRRNVFILDHRASSYFTVGRKDELQSLLDLQLKKINTLIIAPQGMGKSHLIQSLPKDHLLQIDDLRYVKKTLVALILYLFAGDKEEAFELLYQQADKEKVVMKESVKRLTSLLLSITQKDEYTLVIDDLTHITKSGVDALEKLKNHFHIIACARQLKIDFSSCVTNFQKIELPPLKRIEAVELIDRLSVPILSRIEDYETYKNHIYEQTTGNPLFIHELIDRYRKEPDLSMEHVRSITHTTALQELDMSLFIIIGLSSLMVLRYLGGELSNNSGAFRLLGGAFLLFALFARNLFAQVRRKFV
ncbi:MAG: tyrosine-type recombinase/integrase [Saprospiraceae bacterium]|nr:tyrosine-type recombinase/integrase [Saprospiraceae bacterium]